MPNGTLTIRATLTLRNDAILAARAEKQLSQQRLADSAGIPITAVAQIEKMDYTNANALAHAVKIAEILELDLDDVIPPDADYAVPSRVQAQKSIHTNQLKLLCEKSVQRMTLPAPDEVIEQRELAEVIDEMMRKLPFRQQEILQMRNAGYTYGEIGSRFKVSRERVRNIEAQVIEQLKHPTRIRQLENHLKGDVRA